MEIKSATFVISNTDITKCPAPKLPEYAFIGRSNVGKSSLINMLVAKKDMAKTSGKPGKTQLINHFIINENWYLVDLPGYGYAKISREKREKWEVFISEYILKRENLMCMMVLLDSRLPPQKIDVEFMDWLGENGVPFVMVFTKMDKLSKKQFAENMKLYKEEMEKTWDELPQCFYTSAEKKVGRDELLKFIWESNKLYTT
ncbi:MAG TPA: ribosome biogenesis GTP-binding protein YihA/YsxC [Bacteroidia bacterium]|jgi:GTP-binding protein|nr:ribosome biogenesis GTP-binding protein YihA/YsxC [Bacteroidia bacterium]HRG51606.1 ribosome biogenesis GTP-binding protein YihA/YsxC [Bacteroidia bacterium]